MKAITKLVSLVALLTVVSCSPVKVVTDQDRNVDFSQFKTFSFIGWQEDSDMLLNEFDKKRIRDAFQAEFDTRGLIHVDEGGDMEISLFIVLDQKSSTRAYSDYHDTWTGGRHRYGGMGSGYSTTTVYESRYTEGTLVMDVFDSGSKAQIWQAVATSIIDEDPARRDKSIPKKVTALMSEFPVGPVS